MKIFDEANKLANKYHCKMVVLKNGAYPPLVSKYKNSVDVIAGLDRRSSSLWLSMPNFLLQEVTMR